MGDFETIYLQAEADADYAGDGRLWCQDDVWSGEPGNATPTKYIRADIAEARERAAADGARRGAAGWMLDGCIAFLMERGQRDLAAEMRARIMEHPEMRPDPVAAARPGNARYTLAELRICLICTRERARLKYARRRLPVADAPAVEVVDG